ncbi:MAG: alpha-2-macroglobulin family protein, partial [Aureliella sp.]
MKAITTTVACGLALAVGLAMFAAAQPPKEPSKLREQATQLRQQGNAKDALDILRTLLVDRRVPGAEAAKDLHAAVECLQRLGLYGELDPLLADTLAVRGSDWRVLVQAAQELNQAPHHGAVADQKFHRAGGRFHDVGGRWINATEQDRQQSLIWLVRALRLAGELPAAKQADGADSKAPRPDDSAKAPEEAKPSNEERAQVWSQLVSTLLVAREHRWGWRLQSKTSLDVEPDYLDFEAPSDFPMRYASVDEEGRPIFWKLPDSWTEAASDAERLRWALKQIDATEASSAIAEAQLNWANFLQSQFSVDTLAEQPRILRDSQAAEEKKDDGKIEDAQSGILAVHTLGENETIAKLASGIRRFELPEDLNPIRIYQRVADGKGSTAESAHTQLVSIFMNRRQYSKAAELLRQSIERFGDGNGDKQRQLENIVKPRGSFDPVAAQPAGQGTKLSLLFRNAHRATFSARRVDLEKLLSATKDFYRNPQNLTRPAFDGRRDTWPPNFDSPGNLFTDQQLTKFVSEPVASWSIELEPRENHWDRRQTISTPLDKGGLYVVTASLDDGAHLARCLVWINDLAIVRKRMSEKHLVYVADAVTGLPATGVNVEFFGVEQTGNPRRFVIDNFARKTDAQGQIVLPDPSSTSKQWLIIARDARGRISISGTQSFWAPRLDRDFYSQVKAYGVADQPVHRPGGKLRANFWIGRASYAPDLATTPLAHHAFLVQLLDPHGKVFWEQNKTSDEIGGCEVEIDLPETATLGVYSFQIKAKEQAIATNLRVRVEEFRKPEFEIKIDSPEKPVKLGEKIEAKVSARYYFGSPVTNAYVNVKVMRSAYIDDWYPVRPFDWCYGRGYWWFAYDYDWYPGWERWAGCFMPSMAWLPRRQFEPPEIVLEQELTLDAEGTATLAIDTATAAELYGDMDHRYNIEVEVRDASRRTLTASGSVIASREPFKIYSWLGRGFYEVNQIVDANFLAQTLDRRPVAASGKLELLRITYDADREPEETVVETWDAQTDENGNFRQRFVARRGGQYRLRLRLKDESGEEVEGAYVFTVRGDQVGPDNFRFSELELIPDKPEYAPGERVQLQINADRADATVLLFVRPEHGVVPPPRMLKLSGKTAKVEIPVAAGDQPNFFVEALTIYDGKFYSATREIFVPPASRVLDVAVEPNKSEYLPGEKGQVDISVKDAGGMPVAGSVLLAIYDRALEAIAPDTLPEDIREFFWKWRRSHQPANWENLTRAINPVAIDDVPTMTPLGIFGESIGDEPQMSGARLASGGQPHRAMPMMRSGGIAADGMMLMKGMGMGGYAEGAGLTMDAAMAPGAMPGGESAEQAPTAVRKEFADSALWLAKLECDANGRAHASFTMPENLTDWQVRSWAIGPGLRVGSATSSAVTRKHILVRLAAPRFLVERDEVVLSAIVHNDFDAAHEVRVRLEIDGQTQLQLSDDAQAERTVHIAAHEQARVDWPCRALAEGEVTLRAFAESTVESDAMQLKLPVIVGGILKTDSWAGTVRADEASGSMKITVPDKRRVEQSRLTVRLSPSLALAMVDALPYMVEYPYECTEQTLNRFLPTVMTQRMLIDMKIDLEKVKEHRNNLNAQELGDASKRAEGWKRFDRNPVFDRGEVDRMVEAGVQRLTDQQNSDGGWGWFSHPSEVSGAHTTATVVRGLLVAQQNGVAIVPDVLQRGLAWLEQYQNAELQKLQNAATKTEPYKESVSNVDALVFHTLVLGGRPNETMQKFLYEKRADLSVYGKALLAWATHQRGNQEQTAMLRRNIEQFLVED